MSNSNGVIDYDALLRRGDEEDEPRTGSGGYRREPNLVLKETGDTAVLRPLQESKDWYRALTHRFVPVSKGKPEGHVGGWPQMMGATCRKDNALSPLYPGGCPICDSGIETKYGKTMAETVTDVRFTLAIEREKVVGDGSLEMGGPENLGVEGWTDKMVDVPLFDEEGKPTKETVKRPSLIVVSGTMFQMLQALKTMGEAYGSLRDRDFMIKRIKNPNSDKGDIYQWLPMDKIDSIRPGTEHWNWYMETVRNWVPGGFSLGRLIGEKSSDPYYERFWTTNGVFQKPGQGKSSSGPSSSFAPSGPSFPSASAPSATAPSADEPDADKLAAMKARIMSGSSSVSAES